MKQILTKVNDFLLSYENRVILIFLYRIDRLISPNKFFHIFNIVI